MHASRKRHADCPDGENNAGECFPFCEASKAGAAAKDGASSHAAFQEGGLRPFFLIFSTSVVRLSV
ncbi:MAG: hypothetical protein Q9M23_04270, partial [Mariprofundaceae bacterium]|nr:hypothetical protein [Mariprofundaceae bacterium]